ncbi:ABC transporter permease [Streptomyces sp. Li-HN-5-13]|nr:ABC transporter permease [Streptomyces sp. Li-HN-5-13]
MTTTPVSTQPLTDTEEPAAVPRRPRAALRTALRPRTPAGGWRRRPAAAALAALPLAAAVLLWYLLTAHGVVLWLRFDKLPGPVEVYDTLRVQLASGAYYQDLLASLRRILIGFGLAAVCGVAIGIAVGRSRLVQALVRPLIEVARPIPAIALVPLAILMFPTGEQGIVFITFFAAFFPVAVSTIHAMKTLPKVWEEAARTMGAGRLSVLTHVILPGAMPGIFSGLSVSMGVAWICVISAEMISGQFGIGYYTWQSYGLLDYAGVVVGMLSIGILGWTTAWLVERIGSRINRWLPRAAR